MARWLPAQSAAFRRLCVETAVMLIIDALLDSAAFRRLCVETARSRNADPRIPRQPPLGGCVLKQVPVFVMRTQNDQPPLGGCVLKLLQFLQAGHNIVLSRL